MAFHGFLTRDPWHGYAVCLKPGTFFFVALLYKVYEKIKFYVKVEISVAAAGYVEVNECESMLSTPLPFFFSPFSLRLMLSGSCGFKHHDTSEVTGSSPGTVLCHRCPEPQIAC